MPGKHWTAEETRLLHQLIQAGHSYRSAGLALGRTYGQVRSKCRNEGWESKAENTGQMPDLIEAPPDVPCYDGALVLPGELGGGLMIAADVHCPATDWTMAARLALVGQRYLSEPRRLVIAGDFLNFEVFSKYESIIPLPTLRQEIDAARFAIQLWARTFDRIYLTMGNHDYRWLKASKGVFDDEMFTDLLAGLLGNQDKLTINVYSYLDVLSDVTGLWTVTHTPEYSKVPLSKARMLANSTKDRHLICFHQHGAAIALDESSRYMLVDGPALVDPDRLAYVKMNLSSKPQMKRGFVMLRNGWPYLFADGLTDWGYWLSDD